MGKATSIVVGFCLVLVWQVVLLFGATDGEKGRAIPSFPPGPGVSSQEKGMQIAQAPGREPSKRGAEIDITADKITVNERGKVVDAEGNVEIRRGETILKADRVRVNRTTQEVEAKGEVSVDDPEWKMKADSVRLNIEEEIGEIREGEVFVERGHLSLSGRRFQKFTGQVYHIDQGVFTTCLCESGPPSWKISAEEVDLTREGEGVIKGGTFYVLDVPLFYLPYGYFPLRTERQSGFLFPKVGSSTKEGLRFQQPFFWAISRSSDATFGIDVETRARIGLLGELRTVFSGNGQAQINLSYFNEGLRINEHDDVGDRTIASQEIPSDRWSVISTHRYTIPSGWLTYSDIFAFGDDLFTRELVDRFDLNSAREASLRKSRFGRSRFGVFKSWGDMHLQGEWDFFQDFIQSDARTFHKTPQLSFWGRYPLGETPIELRWRAEGVTYLRRKGADGIRLDLRPELLAPFRLGTYLFGSFDLALRETAYRLFQDEGTFDRTNSRELVEVKTNVRTSFERVFAWDGSFLQKIKHVVEPEISYFFIPRISQQDIPIMDGTDRINRRNLLTFSLTNRFWGKFGRRAVDLPEDKDVELLTSPATGEVREMGRLRLALSYDVDKERKGGDSLSDLDLNLRLTPVDYLTLGLDTGLNPGPWQVSQAAAHLSLSDPRPLMRRVLDQDFSRPNQLALNFRFIRRDFLAPLADNANLAPLPDERLIRRNVLGQLDGHVLVHLTDHLLGLYNATYSTRDARFTSYRAGIKILSACECWTVSFSVGRTANPGKTTFKFAFNLLGLGSKNMGLFKGLGFSP
ncbi:MAG: LPS-assembly protein LptD [Candidatus Binatia bacterium]